MYGFTKPGRAGVALRMAVQSLLLWALASTASAQALAPLVEEVPFITTPDHVTVEMLRLANVTSNDYVMDLGSGDGRIVITAAKLFGARGLGVEIVPDLVAQSKRLAQAAGVADRAEFRVQDIFQTDFAPASVITMYLLPEFNLRLRPSLLKLKPGTRLVSHDWDMGDWKPDRSVQVDVPDKAVGKDKFSRLHLWVVPAPVQGLWCGGGLVTGAGLRFNQRFQQFDGVLSYGSREARFDGQVNGVLLQTATGAAASLGIEVDGDVLRITSAPPDLFLLRGARFYRAAATRADCS